MHSFTQIFAAYLNNFSKANKAQDKVLIEYYTSALGPNLAMFAKSQVKPTLEETYEEAERVEDEKESIEDYPEQSGEKTSGKRPLLLSKPKEEQSHDFEGMLKMMQKLSNKIIDLEKEKKLRKLTSLTTKKGKITTSSRPLCTVQHQ